MNDDVFNLELRKFLKRFGVTAQRAIEQAVQSGLEQKQLTGHEVLPVRATLTIPGLLADFVIEGDIALDDASSSLA
jgi:hypothetical protein